MKKITNQDVCEMLKEMDGENWVFGYGHFILPMPCFFVEGKSVNDVCHEYQTMMPISLFGIKDYSLSDDDVYKIFNNINWADVYKNLQPCKVEWALCNKEFIYKDGNIGFQAILPKRVEKAIEKLMPKEKTADDGRSK